MIGLILALLALYYANQAYERIKTGKKDFSYFINHPFWSWGLFQLWTTRKDEVNDELFHKYKNRSIVLFLLAPIIMVIEFVLYT